MLIIRPAVMADIDQLLGISSETGVGMTTMPKDQTQWENKIRQSIDSFARTSDQTAEVGIYFFVLEDTETHTIAGTSALYAGVGLQRPFYSYRISTLVNRSNELDITTRLKVLHLSNDLTGGTELGSLFLRPEYRHRGNGQLLSRCRYLQLADFPERFSSKIFSELRGWVDAAGESPFWNHLGRKFFGLEYDRAEFISAVNGSQFISDLMPKYPIYVDLLPKAAQEVIGKPQESGLPALKLLEKEGLVLTDIVDIFDAGPTVECHREHIYSVKNSRTATVEKIAVLNNEPEYLISNMRTAGYRVVMQPLKISEDSAMLIITPHTAAALEVAAGDALRYIPLRG